jgi:hypothetical protein
MKKTIIFHPSLFSLFPILHLFFHNIGQAAPSGALPSAVVSLVFTFILFLLFRLIAKDTKKAVLLVSIFLFFP